MIDLNKHRFFLVQLLKEIYSDIELCVLLGFKGGTAMMLFYDLPRFSVDLDFNLIEPGKEKNVYEKLKNIVLKYGTIHDEALKHYGPIIVLDYGANERKLKIEISNRAFSDRYEVKNFLGINMKVMVLPDMFAHKLCALLDRQGLANRDIFDCWFFMKNGYPVNLELVENRMKMPWKDYLGKCISTIEKHSEKGLLQGMGEFLDEDMKKFVKNNLQKDFLTYLNLYREFPEIQ
ncbi:MAG: hypothetical protein A2W91_13105 [Bacteroidetes bacterium GWF2_38_335]|nr:MAG: hypothetical protein A2W91_13105 [Bacteroidetes bacterium GWF2_38_335]OFY77194.1 MAG: hypothetical protein A2281_14770 [Bacteroidetes bacterium RIFOXYA12_FULL_38_20]HBS85806.1 hypothetical protein [Bacteroidales bacterium]